MWAMETYRQRHDAVRGTIPFLMQQAIETFKSEGVPRVSLCLIPGLRCQTPLAGDSALARRGLVAGTRYFGLVFDTAAPITSRRGSGPVSRIVISAYTRE